MADSRERVWKLDEDGYRYLISKDEHRDMFMLRRKGFTFKAIGDLYQVTGSHARTLVERHMRVRRARVSRYLKDKNNREEPMTDDLVKRLREDAPRWARDEKWMLAKQLEAAADRIEKLEMALRHCVDAIREYELGDSRPERTPRPDIRPWLLGAMDNARAVLEGKPSD